MTGSNRDTTELSQPVFALFAVHGRCSLAEPTDPLEKDEAD
jgi:hypothetical protein